MLDEERDVGSWDIASSIGIEMKKVSLVVRLLLIDSDVNSIIV
jgi:hypothetical protein